MLNDSFSTLEAFFWMLSAFYLKFHFLLDVECSLLNAEHSLFDVGRSLFDAGGFLFDAQQILFEVTFSFGR